MNEIFINRMTKDIKFITINQADDGEYYVYINVQNCLYQIDKNIKDILLFEQLDNNIDRLFAKAFNLNLADNLNIFYNGINVNNILKQLQDYLIFKAEKIIESTREIYFTCDRNHTSTDKLFIDYDFFGNSTFQVYSRIDSLNYKTIKKVLDDVELWKETAIKSGINITKSNFETVDFWLTAKEELRTIIPELNKLGDNTEEIKDCINNITHLNLSNNMQITTLPNSIGLLSNLRELNLHCCENLSSLPDSIGNLQNLQVLDLSGNPNIHIRYKPYSKSISNKITTLPKSLSNLSNLLKLDLSYNENLIALPENIGNLKCLQILKLSACMNLKSLPDSICNIANLRVLDLDGLYGHFHIITTPITNLPKNIGNLKNLLELYCRSENLISLPDSIGNLNNLAKLYIVSDNLSYLPESIGNLKNLINLDVISSNLTNLPDNIGKLYNLQTLRLRCNSFFLPESIGYLNNLSELTIYWCNNLLSLPNHIGDLDELEELNIIGCDNLTTLPDSVGKLKKLQKLNLQWCIGLTDLPRSIGKLFNLLELDLTHCYNLLSLPDSIGNLKKLQKLNIGGIFDDYDYLDGIKFGFDFNEGISLPNLPEDYDYYYDWSYKLKILPESIGDLSDLQELYLSLNSLTSLPQSIGKLYNLKKLEVYSEKITYIPRSINKLHKLRELWLDEENIKNIDELSEDIRSKINRVYNEE